MNAEGERELLRSVLESTTDGILVTDLRGRIKLCNKKLLNMWRLDERLLLDQQHQELAQTVLQQIRNPEAMRERVEQIYRDVPDDSYDVLEFIDGRVFERFSNVQILEGRHVGRVWSYRDISLKKQQDEALRISEEFNRSIIESSRDCFHILTLGGLLVWMSERAMALFGEHLLGRSWIDFFSEADRSTAYKAMQEAAQGKEGHFTASVTMQGAMRWLDVVVSPIHDAAGTPEKLLAVSRDVTERHQAEDELRRSENRFRQLADAMPQVVWAAAPNGYIDYYNRQWTESTGVPNDQAVTPEDWARLVHPEDLPKCIDHWGRSVRTGTTYQLEFRLRVMSGQYRWHLGRARAVYNELGQITRWYGSSTDIHDHKLAEEALRDETRVLELLNRCAAALAATQDAQEVMQVVTDAGKSLCAADYGAFYQVTASALRLQSLSGKTQEDFQTIHSDILPLVQAFLAKDPAAKMPARGVRDGQPYLLLSVSSGTTETQSCMIFGRIQGEAFPDKMERQMRGIAAQAAIALDNARSYEDLRRAADERERLLEAERASRAEAERMNLMKDEFLATLSHELRTPMNAILGWAEILMLEDEPIQDLKIGLDSIWRNAKAQTQMIEDLLDMSRIISGKVVMEGETTDLKPILDAAFDAVQFAAQAKGIALSKVLEMGVKPVVGDPARLQQIVWNLLSNALKFTSRGGAVELRLEQNGAQIDISVRDNGIGIKPEFLPYVFERFRQADSSLTRKYGGLGLGLAIVKQLVEIHGGTVRAESEGEGMGARFTVSLPPATVSLREKSDGLPGLRVRPPLAQATDLSGIRVLVIDDERDALELIARILQQFKADVFVAGSAAEGRELLLSRHPDVIVSDISMPGKDGYQFIQEVRSLSEARGGSTPAIALTAFARTEDRLRAMDAGYQAHITKPVEVHKLASTIGNLARSRH